MEFGIDKYSMLERKKSKREASEEIELSNKEIRLDSKEN